MDVYFDGEVNNKGYIKIYFLILFVKVLRFKWGWLYFGYFIY